MNLTIKKATILSSLFLGYKYEAKDADKKDNSNTTSDAPIHEDLRKAFRVLIPHFAFICEEITDENLIRSAIQNPEDYLFERENAVTDVFFKYNVYQFEVKKSKNYDFHILTGSKCLKNLDEVVFSTPEIDLQDDKYPFQKELNEAIENVKLEVLAYMQGKQSEKAQLNMFDDNEDNSDDSGDAFGEIKATMSFTNDAGETVSKEIDVNKLSKGPKRAKKNQPAESQ